MRARIVRIGNSQGIRIPKPLLERCRLTGEVELEVDDDRLVIRAVGGHRRGWDEAFRRMAERGDDTLLDPEAQGQTDWDAAEWRWE